MATSRLKSLVATTLAIFLAGSCICVPSLEAKETKAQTPAAKTEPQGIGSLSLFDETQSKAFVLVMDEKYEDAKKLITNAIKQEKRSPKVTNLYYLLSAIEYMDEDYDKAIAHLQLVLNAQPVPKTPDERLNHALILKRIGDC